MKGKMLHALRVLTRRALFFYIVLSSVIRFFCIWNIIFFCPFNWVRCDIVTIAGHGNTMKTWCMNTYPNKKKMYTNLSTMWTQNICHHTRRNLVGAKLCYAIEVGIKLRTLSHAALTGCVSYLCPLYIWKRRRRTIFYFRFSFCDTRKRNYNKVLLTG